ncbi:MAG TPA: UrcA family protein [Steroidobacteraceae bacterium]|nr:UrcA family protein [Steroidobacteraceae bacterium]
MTRIATSMLLIGGLVGLAAAGAAGAAEASAMPTDIPGIVVRFNSDMLATESGTRTLYRRLKSAAERVCPMETNTRLVNPRVQECRQEAVTAAVNKIHNQRLAELHAAANSKSG